jgi:hypothetical protein
MHGTFTRELTALQHHILMRGLRACVFEKHPPLFTDSQPITYCFKYGQLASWIYPTADINLYEVTTVAKVPVTIKSYGEHEEGWISVYMRLTNHYIGSAGVICSDASAHPWETWDALDDDPAWGAPMHPDDKTALVRLRSIDMEAFIAPYRVKLRRLLQERLREMSQAKQ